MPDIVMPGILSWFTNPGFMPYIGASGILPGLIFVRKVCIDILLRIYSLTNAAPSIKRPWFMLLPYLREYAGIVFCP
jgi:hypothetical protein